MIDHATVSEHIDKAGVHVLHALSEVFTLAHKVTSDETPDGYLFAELGPIYADLAKIKERLDALL